LSRRSLIISAAGHAGAILVAVLITASGSPSIPMGGDAVWVNVVTLDDGPSQLEPDAGSQAEDQAVQTGDAVQDVIESPEDAVVSDSTEAVDAAQPDSSAANPVDDVRQDSVETGGTPRAGSQSFSSVSSSGEAGTGAPGPATYEGRVFAAIRRNFRTSVQPGQSYQIELTVEPDGSVRVDTIRTSGTDAFDRAVEHALTSASIPPFPQGRTSPAVLRIEFLGSSGD